MSVDIPRRHRLRLDLEHYRELKTKILKRLGDTLTKSHAEGGLGLSRITSSLVIAAAMVVIIALKSLRERVQAARPLELTDEYTTGSDD